MSQQERAELLSGMYAIRDNSHHCEPDVSQSDQIGHDVKRLRRLALRERYRRELELPASRLLVRIRPLHDSDFLAIRNEIHIVPAKAAGSPASPGRLRQPRTNRRTRKRITNEETEASIVQAEAGLRYMESVYRRACDDAERDFQALGIRPSVQRVHAYQYRIGTWTRICDVNSSHVNTILQSATAEADPGLRRYLPIPETASPTVHDARTPIFPEDRFRKWQQGLRDMIRAGLIHAAAIGWRKTFVLLARTKSLPSRDIFLGTYFWLAQDLAASATGIDSRANDVLLGYSAADASKWNLETLRWHLEEVDLELDPKESYLSRRSEPKKLGVWKEIDFRLRQCFDRSASHLSVSESIAAAVMTYVGKLLFEPAPVRAFAQNIVEKWRLRAKGEEDELRKALELDRERARRVRTLNARWRRRAGQPKFHP